MSWYTAGEIVVWLLLAAVLGGVLGWLLRGILRPPRRRGPGRPPSSSRTSVPARRVDEIDTGASGTVAAAGDRRLARSRRIRRRNASPRSRAAPPAG